MIGEAPVKPQCDDFPPDGSRRCQQEQKPRFYQCSRVLTTLWV